MIVFMLFISDYEMVWIPLYTGAALKQRGWWLVQLGKGWIYV